VGVGLDHPGDSIGTIPIVDTDEIRAEVLGWFERAWDPDLALLGWRERLLESGWAVPSWPTGWYGRGLPVWADRVAHDTIRHAGGVGIPLGGGMGLAAPTIVEHGSDELKRRLLAPTITGAMTWCQLFSEPGAGSDLAGLTTTAERDGDDWVISGQKVWNTSAHHADMAMLVARTSWDAPKHAGITYFALPMHQEGIEVRSIRQMNEHSSFNEVFLTECRVPHRNVIGDVGDGWRVARATLMHERTFATMRKVDMPAGPWGRAVREAKAEADDHLRTYVWYPQRAGRADLLVERARTAGVEHDPSIHRMLTEALGFRLVGEWTAARARRARELGKAPGPEGSLGKLAASELARRCHKAHTAIAGADGMLGATGDPVHDVIAEVLVSTPAQSIAGGTDEIQRNIIGENILGLPREPSLDRGIPFRDVSRN
jgi:alkylation response protein AidB-like acyl-CoA dehydrogenase